MRKVLVFGMTLLGAVLAHGQAKKPLTLGHTITLAGVTGKFDHFAMDDAGDRLFASAAGSHAVEVIDLKSGKVVQSLTGFGKPHGIAWIAETGRLFVSDGDKGVLQIYEGLPLKMVKSIQLSEDADDMLYDAANKLLYVGHGGTNAANPSAVAVIDVAGLRLVKDIAVASHPEGLELDASGDRIFADISDAGEVDVIDGKTQTIEKKWPLVHEKGNTPLTYDAADDLLLIGCRTPAKLVVLSGKTGGELASAASNTGADDLFYESKTHRTYLITGSGFVDSYTVASDGKLQSLARTATASEAKTGLLVEGQGVLYVGVPGTSGSAEVRVYRTGSK
jgi:hypothetical protein